jgi:hypothetical protein
VLLQYKSIAEVSEEALKQMEALYISYKEEVLTLFFASLGKEELSEESTLMSIEYQRVDGV